MNQTIFQFFHWYHPAENNLWNHGDMEAGKLASLGVNQVWLPPACKSAHGMGEPGYAVDYLYDLGEFNQNSAYRYGTNEEYIRCIRSFHEAGIKVLADIVRNHKHGGDEQLEQGIGVIQHVYLNDHWEQMLEMKWETLTFS